MPTPYHADVDTVNSPTWEHRPRHGQYVAPGLTGDESNLDGNPWAHDFYIFAGVVHAGPHPRVEVKTIKPATGTPTLPLWGLIGLGVFLATGGAILFRRRWTRIGLGGK